MPTDDPQSPDPKRRPVLRLPLTPLELALIALIALGLVALIVPLALVWPTLPTSVPSHFGLSGRPDASSGKGSLLALPIIAVLFTVFALALLPFPHIFNYPVQITAANASQMYRFGRGALLAVALLLVGSFAYLSARTVQVAQGHAAGLPGWFTVAAIGLVVALPIAALTLIVVMARRGG